MVCLTRHMLQQGVAITCQASFRHQHYEPFFDHIENMLVPTSVQFELYKWVKRQHNLQKSLEVIALTEQATVIPLTTGIALSAADYSTLHKLSFADSIIYATAQFHEAELVTSDGPFC